MGIFNRSKSDQVPSPAKEAPAKWFGAREADGQIQVSWNTPAEAKKCVADLKLIKAQYQLAKKQIVEQERQLRAAHTDSVRHHTPAVRGGGSVGKFVRGVQVAKHAGDRKHLAEALAPLETRRSSIENRMLKIDGVILEVQARAANPS